MLDRLIQQAIAQVLLPIFDPHFSEASFGFRPGRSAHVAVYRVRDCIRQGYHVAVDADLSKFFNTVDHDVLMCQVGKRVRDKRALRLIGAYLRAGVVVDGRLEAMYPRVDSCHRFWPTFSWMIYKELEQRDHRFARYADDCVILVKSKRAGERVMASITRFLENKLKLTINQDKSKVAVTDAITFLGFAFKGVRIRWSDKAFVRFKQRAKELTGRSWGVSMAYRLFKLAEYLRAGGDITGFRSSIDRSWNWTTGSVAGCGCATGNSGVTAAPRCVS